MIKIFETERIDIRLPFLFVRYITVLLRKEFPAEIIIFSKLVYLQSVICREQ